MFPGFAEHKDQKGTEDKAFFSSKSGASSKRRKMSGQLKLISSITIVFFLFISVPVMVFAESNKTATVAAGVLNLRQNPTVSSMILCQLPKGVQVLITEERAGWYKVTVAVNRKELTGWVMGQYISIDSNKGQEAANQNASTRKDSVQGSETGQASSQSGVAQRGTTQEGTTQEGTTQEGTAQEGTSQESTTQEGTSQEGTAQEGTSQESTTQEGTSQEGSIRSDTAEGASKENTTQQSAVQGTINIVNASVLGAVKINKISPGTINVLSESTIFAIRTGTISVISVNPGREDTTGLNPANASTAGISPAGSSPDAIGPNAEELIRFAKSLLGVPYVYGGMSPAGFDCSGFTSYVFGAFGIRLERVSTDQAKQGMEISRENLKPGDLVFFDTNGGRSVINHTGIFIGDGKFIHASSGTSSCVIISDLTTGYYTDNFMTARRIYQTP